jgi:hypothetical protein
MKKLFIIATILAMAASAFAQEAGPARNSWGAALTESNFHLGMDLQTKYVWRGMEMMTEDAAPVVFPGINYSVGGFYAYVMGGYSINGKYAELDLGLSYTWKWLSVGLNDYYYPTTADPFDRYFDFNKDRTGHWLEAAVTIAPETFPVYLTVSNFFYGADKKPDGRQAYSTYAEIGGYYDFLHGHRISLATGAAFNESCYNGYSRGFSICNVELKYTYNVQLKSITLPLSAAYIINPVYGKSFVNFTASLAF